jgi:hypothetical protein
MRLVASANQLERGMIMRRFLMLVTSIGALGFAGGQALAQPNAVSQSIATQPQLSALDAEIQADSAAIQEDKRQMDRDQSNPARLQRDKHQLFLDTEMQEYHRGADEDIGETGRL